MESKLSPHFFFFITLYFIQFPLEAQAMKTAGCPELLVTPSIISACFNGSKGEVKLEVTQGLPPYQVIWKDGDTSFTRKLAAGEYSVQVTDALGCKSNFNFTIPNYPDLQATVQVTHTSKEGKSNGAIDVEVIGGVPPYIFTWISSEQGILHPAEQGVDRVRKLPAGIYQILVFDSSGCYSEVNTEVK